MKQVDVQKLTHLYGSFVAVDGITFHINKGETLGLLGPNGAGKSTTIKMLTTLLPVTSGVAFIGGFNLHEESNRVREIIGYVPQLISADGELTGKENLTLSARLYGLTRKEIDGRIPEVLQFMGLEAWADTLVNRYSGGMIRRLEIAQACLHRPEVLFLDEPTVGLDPAARKTLWKYIEALRKEMGTTILLTTHDMDEADLLCDTIAFMYQGKIVAMDTPKQLKAALGSHATLDDVFILHTGSSIKETGDFYNVKQTRNTISQL